MMSQIRGSLPYLLLAVSLLALLVLTPALLAEPTVALHRSVTVARCERSYHLSDVRYVWGAWHCYEPENDAYLLPIAGR